MFGSNDNSLLLKMSRPNTFFLSFSFSCNSWFIHSAVSTGNIPLSSPCIAVNSSLVSSYSFCHFGRFCTRLVVAVALSVIGVFVLLSVRSSLVLPLFFLNRLLLCCAFCFETPRPSCFISRSYLLLTRRICCMSTPRCMSLVTICDCDEPSSCSLTINCITWSSVIVDWANADSENSANNADIIIDFFIFVLDIYLNIILV